MFVPVLISLLLWGMWVFAVHTHHGDEAPGNETECQFCQYGAQNSSVLPTAAFALIPVVADSVDDTPPFTLFIAPHLRTHDARAPPFVS